MQKEKKTKIIEKSNKVIDLIELNLFEYCYKGEK